jgi:hypothetical protein
MILLKPLVTYQVSWRSHFIIGAHIIFFFQKLILLVLVEKIPECLSTLNIWLNHSVLVFGTHVWHTENSTVGLESRFVIDTHIDVLNNGWVFNNNFVWRSTVVHFVIIYLLRHI